MVWKLYFRIDNDQYCLSLKCVLLFVGASDCLISDGIETESSVYKSSAFLWSDFVTVPTISDISFSYDAFNWRRKRSAFCVSSNLCMTLTSLYCYWDWSSSVCGCYCCCIRFNLLIWDPDNVDKELLLSDDGDDSLTGLGNICCGISRILCVSICCFILPYSFVVTIFVDERHQNKTESTIKTDKE